MAFHNGYLYESTGIQGSSYLRKVDLYTGNIIQIIELPDHVFGEGLTIFKDKVFQLTWKSNTCFIYELDSFIQLQNFKYSTEGWGITTDNQYLFMSEGTSTLRIYDPDDFNEIGKIDVYDFSGPITNLNELEYINGEIYANVWQTSRIARINPMTGQVTSWIELEGLDRLMEADQPVDSLNGIAYDVENDRLLVTGKLWPKLFEIELLPQE